MKNLVRFILMGFTALLLMSTMPAQAANPVDMAIRPVSGGTKIGNTKRFGIGLQGGPVSGLSLKYYMSPGSALQLGLGGSGWGWGLNVEYLVHPAVLISNVDISIPVYLGVGIGAGNWNSGYWGWGYYAPINVHVPLGLAMQFQAIPFDVFLQAEPGIGLRPEPVFIFGATLGARLFF